MPSDDRFKKIEEIYHSALGREERLRARYLEQACAGEEDLRREVESLLRHDADLSGFMEPAALEQTARIVAAEDFPVKGRTIGPYELTSLLGAGGMGEVYLVRDTRLERLAALKMLPQHLAADPEHRRRLLQEAKAISKLSHPNIVTLYDICSEMGTDFLVMEFVHGKTLDKLIPPAGLPPDTALDYALQIATACEKAHAAGIIHRDLKPGNVIVNEEGVAKVLDFGLAKLVAPEESLASSEACGSTPTSGNTALAGTVPYMSPEQARGEPADTRSDIFSFGVVLYELLTGTRPFEGEDRSAMISALVMDEPKALPAIDAALQPQLESAVLRCLEKDPSRRFQSMTDVRAVLAEVRAPSAKLVIGPAQPRRYGFWLVMVGVLGLALAALSLWRRDDVKTPSRTLTRLTWNGVAGQPTISRDGALIAYSAINGSRSDIWVQRIGEDRAIQVTHDPTGAYSPEFSPDGARIAFGSRHRGVFEMPVTGGEPRFLGAGSAARYLPDGSHLLVQNANGRLTLVSAVDGKSITVHPRLIVTDIGVALSPNGKIAVVRGHLDGGDPKDHWWRVSLSNGELEELALPAGPRQSEAPWPEAWVTLNRDPRRQWLIFGRWNAGASVPYSTGENRNLFRVSISSVGEMRSAPEQLTFTPGTAIYTRASKTGRIVFRIDFQSTGLHAIPIDADTGSATGVAQEFKRLEGVFDPAPSLSRDGRIATFWFRKRIYALDRRTGRETVLTPELLPIDSVGPKASPDGSMVVYYERGEGLERDLYAISSAGGPARRICQDCGVPGGFDSTGKRLLTRVLRRSSGRIVGRIALVDLATGKTDELLNHPSHALGEPSFSWDNRWLTFVERLGDSRFRIMATRIKDLAAPDARRWIPITDGEHVDTKPQFSPGGAILYYVSDRDGSNCIWAQRLEPTTKRPMGAPFPVQHLHQPLNLYRSTPEVNVTMNEIVTHTDLLRGDVWMIDLDERK